MTALGMRLALSRLHKSHGVATPHPVTIPFTPQPTQYAQVLSGYAATLDVDLVRQKFRGWAFGNVQRYAAPRLLFKHNPEREVGTIDSLAYDAAGALTITATVTDPMARRCNAFSVAATVIDYELVNADTPAFYALIKQATLDEVSVTDTPANPAALVTSRRDVCARAEFYDHAASAVARIQQIVALLQKQGTHHVVPTS